MDIEQKTTKLMKFNDLPEEIVFYLSEVFPFGQKLFISGVMENGQGFNLIAT